MPEHFNKKPKSLDEQIDLLELRGMIVDDRESAKFYLQHINYYRLRAYWLTFESDLISHQFIKNTRFQDVLELYIFDRELRLLVLDAIERIEVSVRSQWAYQLAHLHGSHAHLDPTLFNPRFWQRNIDDLTREVKRSEELFIQHFQTSYIEPLPPVWAVCEVMSLGLLSRWYGSLRLTKTQTAIAKVYGVRAEILGSWLHHLSVIRNICAHHSRLWNRDFAVVPQLPTSKNNPTMPQFVTGSRKVYNTLVILLYLMDQVSPQHLWRSRLLTLLSSHTHFLTAMNFPQDWINRSIWNKSE
jgi:abortive infection bacteriophage resistance protein